MSSHNLLLKMVAFDNDHKEDSIKVMDNTKAIEFNGDSIEDVVKKTIYSIVQLSVAMNEESRGGQSSPNFIKLYYDTLNKFNL